MNLFSAWREKSQTKRKENIQRMANDLITLSDFDSRIYIAYMGNPLVQLDESLTATDISDKLKEVRKNWVDAKTKNVC